MSVNPPRFNAKDQLKRMFKGLSYYGAQQTARIRGIKDWWQTWKAANKKEKT